jgi:peptidyl-prolyl cis-trans isomerase D
MVASFNDFAFTHKVGDKDIIKTEFGYHYIEVLGQKGNSTAYNIAYFAKPITLSNETDNATREDATKFIASVKNKKEFDDAVAKIKKQSSPADNIKKEDFNVGILGNNRALVRWVYEKNVGDITDQSFPFNNKYVVAIVTAINKPGLPTVLALRPMVEGLVKNEKKAKQIITKLKGSTLEAMAAAAGNNTIVSKVDTLVASNPYAPIVGQDNKFTGAVFNVSNKGKITEPIAGQNSVFALRVDNIGSRVGVPVDANSIKGMLNNTVKSASGRASGELLKKAAKITDNRGEIF